MKAPPRSWCNSHFRIAKALELSDIPKRLQNANLYNYEVDEDNKEVYERIKPYIERIDAVVDEGKSFFFNSPTTGNGKTFHGAMFLNHYIYRVAGTEKFDFENPLALYVDYVKLIDILRYEDDKEAVFRLMQKIMNVPLLMLDDIGAGTMSDFAREQTFIIINARYENELSTISTSNLSLKELASDKHLGKRIVSRLCNNCVITKLSGADKRFKGAIFK